MRDDMSKNSHQTCLLGLNQQDWLQWKSTNLRLQHQGPKPAEVPVISMILQGRLRKVWYGLMRLLHKEFKCPNRIHPDPLLFSTALKCCCSCETVKLLSWFATVSSLRACARMRGVSQKELLQTEKTTSIKSVRSRSMVNHLECSHTWVLTCLSEQFFHLDMTEKETWTRQGTNALRKHPSTDILANEMQPSCPSNRAMVHPIFETS